MPSAVCKGSKHLMENSFWEGQVQHLTGGVVISLRIAWKARSFYLGLEMELRIKILSAFQTITQIPKLTFPVSCDLGPEGWRRHLEL